MEYKLRSSEIQVKELKQVIYLFGIVERDKAAKKPPASASIFKLQQETIVSFAKYDRYNIFV